MRYLADLLTFARFILAIILLVLAFVGSPAENAFIIFLVAELTDTFDGTCARKWPFPEGKEPKYRKFAVLNDMVSDVLLVVAQVLFVVMRVDTPAGWVIILFYVLCGVLELIVYGKPLGHPDNCQPWSLANQNFPLAKKIILTRRLCYVLCLGVTNAIILFGTSWDPQVKKALFTLGCAICVFAWYFLRERRENISRDAINIEEALTKKAERKIKKEAKKETKKSAKKTTKQQKKGK